MRSTRHRRFMPDRFGRLLDALRPTPEEVRRAHEAGAVAARRMHALIRPALAQPVTDSLIVGAIGLDCAVRPIDAIDLLYLMPAHMGEDGMPAPAALLDGLTHLLGSDAGRIEDGVALPVQGIACRLRPAFAMGDGCFAVPEEAADHWRGEDPLAAAVALRAAGDQGRDVLRLAQAWRRHAGGPASNAAIRAAACDFVRRRPRRNLL